MNRLRKAVVAAVSALLTAGAAAGQTTAIDFKAESGWSYRPATEDGKVVGFLVEQAGPPITPNAFTVVWYERTDEGFKLTQGWQKATAVQAALSINKQRGKGDVFAQSSLAAELTNATNTCQASAAASLAVKSGLAINDPFQAVAALLTPEQMEIVVTLGAAGASNLSAKEVAYMEINGEKTTLGAEELQGLAARVEEDLAGKDGLALALSWFCLPGTYCRSTSVTGPCRLVGGFGNGSCSGCKYSCTVTTFTTCAYISLNCTVGPATTTTTTTTKNKSCAGNPTACPPAPPPGC